MIVRPLAGEDAPLVAALARADEEALRGRPSHVGADEVASWWEGADLEHDSWLFEDDGDVVAVGWFRRWGDIGSCVGIVAQRAKRRGHGLMLIERAEAAATRHAVIKLHGFALADDGDAESPTGATKPYESVGMTVESANVVFEKAAP